jgi:poly-gamma-glutamate capsule biosynthesis protein CapA/YwtB (metallophosphatase superfamily)
VTGSTQTARRSLLQLCALWAALAAAACAHAPRPEPAGELAAPTAPSGAEASTAPTATREAGTSPLAPEPAAAPAEPEVPITVAAVGDIMLGSSFPDDSMGSLLPPDDGAGLLVEVAPVLRGADIAFGNLEGPLLDTGSSDKCKSSKPGRCYAFRVPERYGEHLARAGFKVLSLANNHAGDFGDAGRARTREVLDRLGIAYSGAPGEAAFLEVRGVRVALIAFAFSSATNDLNDVDGAAQLVASLREKADLVVVSFHGGAEGAGYQHVPAGPELFYGEDRGDERRFAHAVIDAGAALVLGHGPHVVRGMELYRGRLVAYSLGNFATYQGMNLSGPNGLTLVLEARVARDGTFLGGAIHPALQEKPGGPRWDPRGAIIPVVRQLSREDFGSAAPEIGDDGRIAAPEPPPVG